MSQGLWIAIAVIAVLVIAALVIGSVRYRRSRISLRRAPDTSLEAPTPVDRSGGYTASSGISFTQSPGAQSAGTVTVPEPVAAPEPVVVEEIPEPVIPQVVESIEVTDAVPTAPEVPDAVPTAPEVPAAVPAAAEVTETAPEAPAAVPAAAEVTVTPLTGPDVAVIPQGAPDLSAIAPSAGRLERLRGRLAKSQNAFGRSMLGLLGGGDLDEDSWEEVEDTLLVSDLGPTTTASVVEHLRSAMAAGSVRNEAQARAVLREVLIAELNPEFDRSIRALPHADKPSVLLIVGVNGTGKTTTVGKLARVLVADGRRVVLGAADTFRAAAADQLQSWGSRVGAEVVRGPEGADPASVAFDAVDEGISCGADVVVIDTAGRLHTKTGLMDELGKVKRVVEKRAAVDEVLLVLDATIGQNGLVQARVFADVVNITGVVLTKLDGTAKGGIVFRVQQELGVPVKLVGLGEGPDDLAPFEPAAFVDALLG
ncbi:MAG: signal recognition particle-docking protein FtsY [Mycobacterium sp.]|nr:signal recognition particle-docking protein FtsY [Mycobacterium sp.]